MWHLTDTPSSPDLDFSMAQISPDAFQTVSMDISEGKQQQNVQSEPMEDSHNQSDHQSIERGRGQQRRPLSFVEVRYHSLFFQSLFVLRVQYLNFYLL